MKASSRIVYNTFVLYTKLFLSILIGLYTTRLVLNALGQTDYGIYALVAGIVGMLSFLQASMSQASVRFIAHSMGTGDLKLMNKVYNTTILIHYIFGLILIILLEILGYFMFEYWLNIPADRLPDAKWVFQFMIVTAFISIISVPFDAIISSKENFLALSIIDVFGILLTLGIAVFITLHKQNQLFLYGALMMGQQFIVRVLKQIYSRLKYKEYKVNLFQKPDNKIVKDILSFSGWNLVSAGGVIVSNQMKGIFLNMFFGVALNAADGIAKALSGKMNSLVINMSNAFGPQIVKSEGSGNRGHMLTLTYINARLGILVFGMLSVPLLIEMPIILKIWLKEVPEYATIFVRLLIIDLLIRRLSDTLPGALKAIGRIKEINVAVGIITLASIPVSYLLFWLNFPPYAIYLISIGVSFLLGINRLYYSNKIAKIDVFNYLKTVVLKSIVPIIISFLFSIIPLLFYSSSVKRLFLTTFGSLIISLIFIRLIAISNTEYNRIKGFVCLTINRYRNKST